MGIGKDVIADDDVELTGVSSNVTQEKVARIEDSASNEVTEIKDSATGVYDKMSEVSEKLRPDTNFEKLWYVYQNEKNIMRWYKNKYSGPSKIAFVENEVSKYGEIINKRVLM